VVFVPNWGFDMPSSWECLAWKSNGGYANQKKEATQGKQNAYRERIWFSPHCLKPGLFSLETEDSMPLRAETSVRHETEERT